MRGPACEGKVTEIGRSRFELHFDDVDEDYDGPSIMTVLVTPEEWEEVLVSGAIVGVCLCSLKVISHAGPVDRLVVCVGKLSRRLPRPAVPDPGAQRSAHRIRWRRPARRPPPPARAVSILPPAGG